ncbi:hypothetical protein K456DRAFT_33057 [Colletotrichum gloeosporioides 23]|nr:hypothetical protein K456DRAFT_33057 [Colletotrichum gloeosporioides 23]
MPYLSKGKRNPGRKKMICSQHFLDDEHRGDAVAALEQASDDALPGWLSRRHQNQNSRLYSLPDELILEIIDCMNAVDFWFFRQVSYRLANACAGFHLYSNPQNEEHRPKLCSKRESNNWIRQCYQRYIMLYSALVDRNCRHRFCSCATVSTRTQTQLDAITRKFFETDFITLWHKQFNTSLEPVSYLGVTLMAQYPFRKEVRKQRIASLLCSECISTKNQRYRYDSPVDALWNLKNAENARMVKIHGVAVPTTAVMRLNV